ncbi:MAG TPA: DUF2934 domain-containing protein [Vicinamibacterales bacterium]|jgi:hypothetical protein|nr:DUF2934 domain-containing protein [Vicinamibacterales bacterium]
MMDTKKSVTSRPEGFTTPADRRLEKTRVRALATKDHDLIRQWAQRHHAEPSTGEATESGPATTCVNDGGGGVRFNFPGFSRFRPISWAEWFDNFDRHALTFVFEEEVADRAYEHWQARGCGHGHDRDDWFRAENEIGKPGAFVGGRYRLVKEEDEDNPARDS